MVTADAIAEIEIFAELDAEQREALARASADVSLAPGEYAVDQGGERALFAVLDGLIEAVRRDDGVERIVGQRRPGDCFGEVPITLGTVFPVGFRARLASRVLRLDAHDYHALVAAAPKVERDVAKLAAHRIGGARGLQGLAAEPSPPRAIVLGHRWDAPCAELRRFLDRNQVTFLWIKPDEPGAAERWGAALPADEDCPVIRIMGGDTAVRPHHRQVAELLGLSTEPETSDYDVVVVGAGPAGLAAGVYGASEGLRTIVIEREAPGGQAGTSSRIENYLGFPQGVSGAELASYALLQARRLGAEILVTRAVTRIDAETRRVHLDGGDALDARAIILACGVSWRQLSFDGAGRLVGKGISYGATRRDAEAVHGLDVHILGAGNSAGQAALSFSQRARRVTILCRAHGLEKSMSRYLIDQLRARDNIEVLARTEVAAVHGDDALEGIDVRSADHAEVRTLESSGLFVFIGADAETGWLSPEIAVDHNGYVLTGPDAQTADGWPLDRDPYLLETSVPGIFACGDVRYAPVKRVAAAVGEGSMAIAFVHRHLGDA